jgi:hypothetical protein
MSKTRNVIKLYSWTSKRVLKIGVNIKMYHRKTRCDWYFVHLDGCVIVTAFNKMVPCVSKYVRLNTQ